MGLSNLFRRKRHLTDDERRESLLIRGRITEGIILESRIDGDDEIVHFAYTLNGVDFEAFEKLTASQRLQPVRYAPGAKVNVRYDPRNQGNSTLE